MSKKRSGEGDTYSFGTLNTGDFAHVGPNYGHNIYQLLVTLDSKAASEEASSKILKLIEGNSTLGEHINVLKEWKEVHNLLDDLRRAFDQFYNAIIKVKFGNQKAFRQSIVLLWSPYSEYEGMYSTQMEKVKNITIIPKEVKEKDETFRQLNRAINTYLGFPDKDSKDYFMHIEKSQRRIDESVFLKIKRGNPYKWWDGLYNLSHELNGKLTTTMYIVDKALLDRATRLCNFYGYPDP